MRIQFTVGQDDDKYRFSVPVCGDRNMMFRKQLSLPGRFCVFARRASEICCFMEIM